MADNNVMHAKFGLRVLFEWKIYRPDSVITAVIQTGDGLADDMLDQLGRASLVLNSMSTQICPKCHTKQSTWHIDEDVTPFTQWFCVGCETTIFEDESKQRTCEQCEKPHEMYCWDEESKFWWCTTCNAVKPA